MVVAKPGVVRVAVYAHATQAGVASSTARSARLGKPRPLASPTAISGGLAYQLAWAGF